MYLQDTAILLKQRSLLDNLKVVIGKYIINKRDIDSVKLLLINNFKSGIVRIFAKMPFLSYNEVHPSINDKRDST